MFPCLDVYDPDMLPDLDVCYPACLGQNEACFEFSGPQINVSITGQDLDTLAGSLGSMDSGGYSLA